MGIRSVLTLILWSASSASGLPNSGSHAVHSRTFNSSAQDLFTRVLEAMGGEESLSTIEGITYEASSIYRSQTLTQSYNLKHSDQSVAEAGAQNMSFSFVGKSLCARIDRSYSYNDYWIWAHPALDPSLGFSVVLQDGPDGFASFTKGENSFFAADPTKALGYADPYLTDYLIHQAHQFALPWLLKQFAGNKAKLILSDESDAKTNQVFPGLRIPNLDLTLIFNSSNFLPLMIRSYEMHSTLGSSTSDLILTNYSSVSTGPRNFHHINFPHRMQTLYNTAAGTSGVLEDFIIDSVTIIPTFPAEFFHPLPSAFSSHPASGPQRSQDYPRSEVHEFFETALWDGPFPYNISDVVATNPIPDLDKVHAVYIGYPDYVQLVVELDTGVLVTDAPPHRSKILIQWVHKTLGKPITHVVPSHHHRDHAGGVPDYVAAGATLVVPEAAADLYRAVQGGRVRTLTYNATAPFALGDAHVQFRSVWHREAPHARDWTYAVASKTCPGPDDGVVAFNADVWSPGGDDGRRWDTGYARQWLDDAVEDGLPRSARVVGAHGSSPDRTSGDLEGLVELVGYAYPPYTAQDWKAGGGFCPGG